MADRQLDALALALVDPLRIGDLLADGGELVGITAELALQYEIVDRGMTVSVEVIPRAGARTERVTTTHFAVGHRAGTMDDARAIAMCRAIAARISSNEDAVMGRVRAEPVLPSRIREVRSDRALVREGSDAPSYALSPYRGCTIGCTFCYAQSRLQPLRTLLGLDPAPWGSWVDAAVDMPNVLADELARLPIAPIKFCPIVADPYQAIEQRLRITRGCVEAIAACTRTWPALVLTRARAIVDDLALWSSLPRAWVGVSLPTIDDTVRRHFEPRAASVAERLDVLRRFADGGVPTFAVVQPLLPGDIDALADALVVATAGVAIGTLEGEENAGARFDTYDDARSRAWQEAQAARLRDALAARNIPLWSGELPPGALA